MQKFDRDLIKFSQDIGVVKKEKEQKFLTIQGLLDHPYFIGINEADISIVIDEFEKLQQPNYDLWGKYLPSTKKLLTIYLP